MTEADDIFVLERVLKKLKKEESVIIEFIFQVRKQLNRYQIEKMHNLNLPTEGENEDSVSLKSNEMEESSIKKMLETLDCPNDVNQSNIDLTVSQILKRYDMSSEEEENSDSDIIDMDDDMDEVDGFTSDVDETRRPIL